MKIDDQQSPNLFGQDTSGTPAGPHADAAIEDLQQRRATSDGEAQLRLLFGTQAIWETDANGAVIADSPSWRAFTGQTLDQWLGYGWLDAIHPDDRAYAEQRWQEAVEACEIMDAEFRLRAPGGGWRWTNVRAIPVLDGEGRIGKWAGMNIDIDARKRAEQQLIALNDTLEQQVQERTAELSRLWQTSPDILLVIDSEGVFRQVNPAWTTVLGYRPEELVGHHVNEFVIADDHAETVDAYTLAAEGGQPRIVNRYRHKDGSIRWISWVGAQSGEVTYATGRNVTAERKQAAELAQAQDQLRQAQKVEAIGQLTGGVAHDFNNLLTVIRGSVDLLRRENIPFDKRQRYLDAIGDTADRAAKLTGQLLAFARRQTLEPEIFEVAQRLDGISDMLDSIIGTRVQIRFEVPETACRIHVDVSQFETALVNLAVNARDAMEGEGTVTVRLRCDARMPAIRGHGPGIGKFVAVSITDTGTGISVGNLERIFEPFFTTKDVGKGTGLGLSQVFGFAKQSGGDVDVESVPGKGSTFTLYLPQADPTNAEDVRSAGPTEILDGGGSCVLIVEDNISVGQFATQLLDDLGYRTAWVTSAEEALERLGADGEGFDIVFTDVVMPGMGGIDLARRLARDLPALPVVLASGYSHVLAQEGLNGLELIRKPYSANQLSTALQRRIAWAAAMQA